jgi:hypothetical protein
VASLARHLPGVSLGPLVEGEPLLLRVDVASLLAEVHRLMPVSGGGDQRRAMCARGPVLGVEPPPLPAGCRPWLLRPGSAGRGVGFVHDGPPR